MWSCVRVEARQEPPSEACGPLHEPTHVMDGCQRIQAAQVLARSQSGTPSERQALFVDVCGDLHVLHVHTRAGAKLASMAYGAAWHDVSPMLAAVIASKLMVWYCPAAVHQDAQLEIAARHVHPCRWAAAAAAARPRKRTGEQGAIMYGVLRACMMRETSSSTETVNGTNDPMTTAPPSAVGHAPQPLLSFPDGCAVRPALLLACPSPCPRRSDLGDNTHLVSFCGSRARLRRASGACEVLALPPAAVRVHELTRAGAWDRATRLCRWGAGAAGRTLGFPPPR